MGHVNRFQILKVETADLVKSVSGSHILRCYCCQGREKYRQTDIDIQTYMHTDRQRQGQSKESQKEREGERGGGGGGRRVQRERK